MAWISPGGTGLASASGGPKLWRLYTCFPKHQFQTIFFFHSTLQFFFEGCFIMTLASFWGYLENEKFLEAMCTFDLGFRCFFGKWRNKYIIAFRMVLSGRGTYISMPLSPYSFNWSPLAYPASARPTNPSLAMATPLPKKGNYCICRLLIA